MSEFDPIEIADKTGEEMESNVGGEDSIVSADSRTTELTQAQAEGTTQTEVDELKDEQNKFFQQAFQDPSLTYDNLNNPSQLTSEQLQKIENLIKTTTDGVKYSALDLADKLEFKGTDTEKLSKVKDWMEKSENKSNIMDKLKNPLKYFMLIAILAGAIGGTYGILQKIAGDLTGCYLINTSYSNPDISQLSSCATQDNCNCATFTALNQSCGNNLAPCSDTIQYMWKKVTPADVISHFISTVAQGVGTAFGDATSGFWNMLSGLFSGAGKYILLAIILIVLIIVGYIILKKFVFN